MGTGATVARRLKSAWVLVGGAQWEGAGVVGSGKQAAAGGGDWGATLFFGNSISVGWTGHGRRAAAT